MFALCRAASPSSVQVTCIPGSDKIERADSPSVPELGEGYRNRSSVWEKDAEPVGRQVGLEGLDLRVSPFSVTRFLMKKQELEVDLFFPNSLLLIIIFYHGDIG